MFVSGPECRRLIVFRRVSETVFLPFSSPQAEAHADFLSFRSSVYNGLAKAMPSFLNMYGLPVFWIVNTGPVFTLYIRVYTAPIFQIHVFIFTSRYNFSTTTVGSVVCVCVF